jgi:hypothetical protein
MDILAITRSAGDDPAPTGSRSVPKATLNKVQKLHFLSTMKFQTLSFELALMLTRSSK